MAKQSPQSHHLSFLPVISTPVTETKRPGAWHGADPTDGGALAVFFRFLSDYVSRLPMCVFCSSRPTGKGVEGLARVGSRAALSFAFAFLRRAWRSGTYLVAASLLAPALQAPGPSSTVAHRGACLGCAPSLLSHIPWACCRSWVLSCWDIGHGTHSLPRELHWPLRHRAG